METWRSVPGFEGVYEVSDQGRVRSLPRQIQRRDGLWQNYRGRLLRLRQNSDGYLQTQLCRGDKIKTVKVHRLVAEVFIANPHALPEVNHKDENKRNNAVSNLEWCTHLYNSRYGTRGARISENGYRQKVVAYAPDEAEPVLRFKSIKAAAAHFGVTAESARQALAYGWKCKGYKLEKEINA